jgi:hypothetical protein
MCWPTTRKAKEQQEGSQGFGSGMRLTTRSVQRHADTLNYPATSPWSGKHEDGCVTRLPDACVVCSHGPRKHTAEAYPGAGQSFDTAGLSLIPNTGKADSLPAHTCLRCIGMLIIVPNTIEIAHSGPKSEGFGFVSNTRECPSGWYGARVDDTVALVMNHNSYSQ